MKATTGKDDAKHIIRTVNVMPACLVPVSYTPLLIYILELRMELMKIKQWWMRRQVGQRLTIV
jgi:hypothetical protein